MKKHRILITLAAGIMVLTSLSGCGTFNTNSRSFDSENTKSSSKAAFPELKGTDFDGNAVDNSLFSKNAVTVVNFWFNGCPPCVEELPALSTLNEELRKQGAELIGINAIAGENDELLNEAKDILSKQNATYRNIYYAEGSDLENFANQLEGFPTTFLVDRNGTIIGDCFLGAIDDEKTLNVVKQRIEDIISADKGE